MKSDLHNPPGLEDVASLPPAKELALALDEVGLENVQTQVQVQGLLLPARAAAAVSLTDTSARGIHMSRLFKILSRLHEQELSWAWLTGCLEQMLLSHQSLSDAGHLRMSFDLPVLRRALLSEESGWRSYPLTYSVSISRGQRKHKLSVRVLYSSTCPCSENLSRQLLSRKFQDDFREPETRVQDVVSWLESASAIVAVPHSQRSEAICEFTLDPQGPAPAPISLIDEIESALGTPVQAAVKREDEQEFARLNAANLMFCEDAARKLKAALSQREELVDFAIEVRHFESLHPHDVVAKARK